MTRANIHKVMEMLKLDQIADRPAWVSSTCPFLYWTHSEKSQRHPRNSFGIMVGETSIYQCFSCGKVGALMNLPFALHSYSRKDYPDLRRFIFMNEHVKVSSEDMGLAPAIPRIHLDIIPEEELERKYDEMPPYRGLTKQTVQQWGLKYDKERKRMIIPIRDKQGHIVALKGRALSNEIFPKYYLYTEYNPHDPKSAGIWFGIHKPLIPSKALVLVEGEIDTMLVAQTNMVSNVWGVMGVGITATQIMQLSSIKNPLVFFFDNDEAGYRLKQRLHNALHGLSPHYEVTNYYGKGDAGDAAASGVLRNVLKSVRKMA